MKRLQEPSTHAALASLAGTVGFIAVKLGADPASVAQVGIAAQAGFGLLGALLPEAGGQ
jgi:hypothetical protein